MIKCSHEDLQDAHVMLQVSHEVVVTSVKHFQPHTQEYICSPNFINPICANAYCSQSTQSNVEQINVDSCDDLIPEENDTLKLEVKMLEQKVKVLEKQVKVRHPQDNHRNMVNKLENGSNSTKRASQQSNKAQSLKRQQKDIKDEKIKYARSAYLNARMSHIKNGIDYKMSDKHNTRVNTKGQKFIKFTKANVQQEKKQNTKITTIKTSMDTNGHLDINLDGTSVNQKVYRSVIESLLYLCASMLDIMLSVCMCARFQAAPKDYHLSAVKRIMRYLVLTPNLGLWYPKGSCFELLRYFDADCAECKVDRNSTSGTCQFLGWSLVSWSSKK
jgi:hypothetical protein